MRTHSLWSITKQLIATAYKQNCEFVYLTRNLINWFRFGPWAQCSKETLIRQEDFEESQNGLPTLKYSIRFFPRTYCPPIRFATMFPGAKSAGTSVPIPSRNSSSMSSEIKNKNRGWKKEKRNLLVNVCQWTTKERQNRLAARKCRSIILDAFPRFGHQKAFSCLEHSCHLSVRRTDLKFVKLKNTFGLLQLLLLRSLKCFCFDWPSDPEKVNAEW